MQQWHIDFILSLEMTTKAPVVDIHSHIFPNTWISLLQSRTTPPYIDINMNTLVSQPGVTGKPLLANHYDVTTKIDFMEQHGIDVSVLSLGNPWLDFLIVEDDKAASGDVAGKINEEMEQLCREHQRKLYFFASLPITGGLRVVLRHVSVLSHTAEAWSWAT
jgi:predicted TIM-barrel fold metal-dependent hydrolase